MKYNKQIFIFLVTIMMAGMVFVDYVNTSKASIQFLFFVKIK